MTDALHLIGAGGHAKVVLAAARAAGLDVAGLYDQDPGKTGTVIMGLRAGAAPPAAWWTGRPAHLAIGSNAARKRLAGEFACLWTAIVSPSAHVDATAIVGAGAFVATRAVIHPDARVGESAIVNTGAIVEHDCRVGAFCHLAPGSCLAGGAAAGEGAFVGMGACILPGVRIGAWAVIGAGAVVKADVADGLTVAGVPARPVPKG